MVAAVMTAPDLRQQLAALINELTRPQPLRADYSYDVLAGDDQVVSHEGRTHATTTPPLLEALEAAVVPAPSAGVATGVFESQPAADLDAAEVLDGLRRNLRRWARYLHLDTGPDVADAAKHDLVDAGRNSARSSTVALATDIERALAALARRIAAENELIRILAALLEHDLTDDQAGKLVADLEGWIRTARVVVGLDRSAFDMRERCPYCDPNAYGTHLRVSGDLQQIKCRRCSRSWTPDTFELLRRVLNDNHEREKMTG